MEPGSEEPGDRSFPFRWKMSHGSLQWSRAPKSPVTQTGTIPMLISQTCFNGAGLRRAR